MDTCIHALCHTAASAAGGAHLQVAPSRGEGVRACVSQVAALVMLLSRPQFEGRAAALRSLALAGNALTDQHVGMLLEGLQGLLQIERMDLSDNRLSRVAVGALCKALVDGRAKHVRPPSLLCLGGYAATCTLAQ